MKTIDEIHFSSEARNFIKKCDPKLKQQLKESIESLKTMPPAGDIKSLEGYKDGRMRMRIGKYRVIFRYEQRGDQRVIHIIDRGSRGDIYK